MSREKVGPTYFEEVWVMRALGRRVVEADPMLVGGVAGDCTVFQYWGILYQRNRWFLLASSFQIWRMRAKPTVSSTSFWRRARRFRQTVQDPRSFWAHATPGAKGHGEETPACRFARSVIFPEADVEVALQD